MSGEKLSLGTKKPVSKYRHPYILAFWNIQRLHVLSGRSPNSPTLLSKVP